MSQPLSSKVPDEIAEIIRSNADWGDLTRFAEAEGLKRSTVYSLLLYRKNKTLIKLYRLALTLDTTVDEIYDLLLIQNTIERKARFQLLMSRVGIETFGELCRVSKLGEHNIYKYLNNEQAFKLFEKPFIISRKMRISLHEFAAIFASEYSE